MLAVILLVLQSLQHPDGVRSPFIYVLLLLFRPVTQQNVAKQEN